MTVSVLSTGNELLYGTTIDTNSGRICAMLFPLDLRVVTIVAAGDDREGLVRAFRHCLDISDTVIITGGLGPTDDDNTIAALGRMFDFNIVNDGASLSRMERFFEKLGMPMSRGDLKMTEVPDTARVLENLSGLAPGFILREGGKTIISLPGVPREMSDMMQRAVIPYLTVECGIAARRSLAFRVIGMKESDVNAAIVSMKLEDRGLQWGITAEDGIDTVTIVENGSFPDAYSIGEEMRGLFGIRLLGSAYGSPEEEILSLLKELKLTLSSAESCTGGLVAKRLTDIPGSSDVFVGGVTVYANGAKIRLLGVSPETLEAHGAVSPETAAEMAAGARSRLETDIGIAVTGIAGPGGGSAEKPVGTVWFGLAHSGGVQTAARTITGDRGRVRTISSLIALELIREYLLEQKGGVVV
ncbi:MAG TPA: CinA family nicotinamide mononucleotide deamidase-related protein [Spirochaetota bacterium]|nr:CinA family nicotinamide mononucleotide deamidase-related protein [Spirochaetota bacterium]